MISVLKVDEKCELQEFIVRVCFSQLFFGLVGEGGDTGEVFALEQFERGSATGRHMGDFVNCVELLCTSGSITTANNGSSTALSRFYDFVH